MTCSHDFAIWAKSFGAIVTENITKRTTHVVASPLRKTAKVRQAAKKPDRIKIVSQTWLFDCLVQWQKVDETPFRLHADLENDTGEPATNRQTSPFDGPDQNAQLSSSDEEAAVTEEEDSAETPGTENDADAVEQAELERYIPSLPRESSSLHTETQADLDDWTAELDDFLNGESLSESEAENTDYSASEDNDLLSVSARKRKRNGDDQPSDTDDSDSSLSGSRLQRRKRKALARTTSLVSVSAVTDSQKNKAEAQGNNQPTTTSDAGEENVEEEEDDLEAQLEAEMLRQAEEDGDA